MAKEQCKTKMEFIIELKAESKKRKTVIVTNKLKKRRQMHKNDIRVFVCLFVSFQISRQLWIGKMVKNKKQNFEKNQLSLLFINIYDIYFSKPF